MTIIRKISKKRALLKFVFLCFSVCFFAPFKLHAAEDPVYLVGRWKVIKVRINQSGSRRLNYELDDSRLIGRIFRFSRNKITNDTPEASVCEKPQISTELINMFDLIGGSLGGYGYPSRRVAPADYGINVNPAYRVTLMRVTCDGRIWEGGLGAGNGPNGAWMVFFTNETLAIRWYDESIIILRKMKS